MSSEIVAKLKLEGWYLTAEGISEIIENKDDTSVKSIIKYALDTDLKSIGAAAIPDDLGKGKRLPDTCVLQIVKINNVSAPKINEESNHAPRLLKIVLTDGLSTCTALDLGQLKSIDVHTPPGTKVKLKGGSISCQQGYLFLTSSNFENLGGNVEALIKKWKLKEALANYSRSKASGDGGPPPWVPFGQRISGDINELTGKFKSFDTSATKEAKENDAFELQRKATIAEISKAKIGGCKTFGGGKLGSERETHSNDRYSKPRIGDSYGTSSAATAAFTDKPAFTRSDAGVTARGERGDTHSSSRGRPERSGRGRGRRDEDDEGGSIAPSRPSTLFDFLQSKIDSIEGKTPSDSKGFDDHHNDFNATTNSSSRETKSHSTLYESRKPTFREDWNKSSSHDYEHRPPRGGSSFRGGRGGRGTSGTSSRPTSSSYGGGSSRFGDVSRPASSANYSNAYNNYGSSDSRASDGRSSAGAARATSNYDSNRTRIGEVNSNLLSNANSNSTTSVRSSNMAAGDDNKFLSSTKSDRSAEASRMQSTSHNDNSPKIAFDGKFPANASVKANCAEAKVGNNRSSSYQENSQSKFAVNRNDSQSTVGHQPTRAPYGNHVTDNNVSARPPREASTTILAPPPKVDKSSFENMTCPPIPDFGIYPNNFPDCTRSNYYGASPQHPSSRNAPRGNNFNAYQSDAIGRDPTHNRSHPPPPPYMMPVHQPQQQSPIVINIYQPTLRLKANANSFQPGSEMSSQHAPVARPSSKVWQSGDECLAKYWEDNKYYPAMVHAVGPSGTCVVLFSKYGNYEEVFIDDMKSWKNKEEQGNYQMNTGTVEFRRGGTRPYVVRNNFPHQLDQDSFRQSSGRPTQQVYVPPAQRQ